LIEQNEVGPNSRNVTGKPKIVASSNLPHKVEKFEANFVN